MSRLRLLICVLSVTVGSACSPAQDTKIAEQVVRQFREQMASASLADIYDSAAPDWRKTISRSDSDAFLGAVNKKLGAVKPLMKVNALMKINPLTRLN